MRNIIAFDLGGAGAWAANFKSGSAAVPTVMTGVWDFTKEPRGHRFLRIYNMARRAMDDASFDAVVYERPFARGMAATRVLWGIAALIEAAADDANLPCVDVVNTAVKAMFRATGERDVSKAKMQVAATMLGAWRNEHEADALCLLAYAQKHMEFDQ